jgi:hypothetical protein
MRGMAPAALPEDSPFVRRRSGTEGLGQEPARHTESLGYG